MVYLRVLLPFARGVTERGIRRQSPCLYVQETERQICSAPHISHVLKPLAATALTPVVASAQGMSRCSVIWHRNIKSPAQHGMVLAWAWQLFLHRAMHSVARDSCQPHMKGEHLAKSS